MSIREKFNQKTAALDDSTMLFVMQIIDSMAGERKKPRAGRVRGCCSRARGILADCPDMSVDSFLERKHADKELDL